MIWAYGAHQDSWRNSWSQQFAWAMVTLCVPIFLLFLATTSSSLHWATLSVSTLSGGFTQGYVLVPTLSFCSSHSFPSLQLQLHLLFCLLDPFAKGPEDTWLECPLECQPQCFLRSRQFNKDVHDCSYLGCVLENTNRGVKKRGGQGKQP